MSQHIHADALKSHHKAKILVPKIGTIWKAKKGGQNPVYLQSGFLFAGEHGKMTEDARWNALKVQENLRWAQKSYRRVPAEAQCNPGEPHGNPGEAQERARGAQRGPDEVHERPNRGPVAQGDPLEAQEKPREIQKMRKFGSKET